ncbi:MAG: hypothetical protein BroJett015_23870 [Chloroflexota bacterium]|nr:MAG: hypothetical protein BroJett015_23870 [Chloroflexota bacterium]
MSGYANCQKKTARPLACGSGGCDFIVSLVNSGNLKIQTYGLAATADKKRCKVHKISHRAQNRNKEMGSVNSGRKIQTIQPKIPSPRWAYCPIYNDTGL